MHRSLVLALCCLLGCDASTPLDPRAQREDASVPVPRPPPVAPTLTVSQLAPGGVGRFTVDGALPGDVVKVIRGRTGGPTCPPQLSGLCLDLRSPKLLVDIPTDTSGHGEVELTLPGGLPVGLEAAFQGAVPAGVDSYVTQAVVTTTLAAGACADDGYEDNDGPASARELTAGRAESVQLCSGDDDFFQVPLLPGDVLSVDAVFAHASGNIDLELYDPDGILVGSAASTTDDESLVHTATTGGYHRVRAALVDASAGNAYTLTASIDPGVWLSGGPQHTCAVDADGATWCFGRSTEGQLAAPAGLVAIAAGGVPDTAQQFSCGLDGSGAVCWGADGSGQVSDAPAGSFTGVDAGGRHACALDANSGDLACWGGDTFGQATPPVPSGWAAVSTGATHTCAIDTAGSLACWGNDNQGQSSPPGGAYTAVSAGVTHTCAVPATGTGVDCFGVGAAVDDAPGGGTFVDVASGTGHACALSTDGQVLCWGDDTSGQASPPDDTFVRLTAGGAHTCGVRADRSFTCWGNDDRGQAPACIGSLWPIDLAPTTLSQTGLYRDTASKILDHRVHAYTPQFPLWSDGSDKSRWAYIPECGVIDNTDEDDWDLPLGTRMYKEFVVDGGRVETRMIAQSSPDVVYAAYVWDGAELDGDLWDPINGLPDAAMHPGGVTHDVPTLSQCQSCHGGNYSGGVPARYLGFSAMQLSHGGSEVAMTTLTWDRKLLVPNAAGITVPGNAEEKAALGYLHANCGNCHNLLGEGVYLPNRMDTWISVDDVDVASTGTYLTAVDVDTDFYAGASKRVNPGNPSDSALWVRMSLRAPGETMPPVGTKDVDDTGLAVIEDWILGM